MTELLILTLVITNVTTFLLLRMWRKEAQSTTELCLKLNRELVFAHNILWSLLRTSRDPEALKTAVKQYSERKKT